MYIGDSVFGIGSIRLANKSYWRFICPILPEEHKMGARVNRIKRLRFHRRTTLILSLCYCKVRRRSSYSPISFLPLLKVIFPERCLDWNT